MVMASDERISVKDEGILSAADAGTRRAKTADRRGPLNKNIFAPASE